MIHILCPTHQKMNENHETLVFTTNTTKKCTQTMAVNKTKRGGKRKHHAIESEENKENYSDSQRFKLM